MEIMFIYMGDCKFDVRFFKQDPELVRVNQQLNKRYRSY